MRSSSFFHIASLIWLVSHPSGAEVATSDVPAPSFRREVQPVLTRFGCNQGGCHGKQAGQNGFRLSLRGFAPDWDYEWITRAVNGRRIDYAFPEKSLLVEKASGGVQHEGGTRFRNGSPGWQTLVDWINAKAPGPLAEEAMPLTLDVTPSASSMRPGESQTLTVLAREADGSTTDVTWLAQFFSNDEARLEVTPAGKVTARSHGEASVRIHFLNLVQVVRFTMPFEQHEVSPELYRERRNAIDAPLFNKLEALRLPPADDCGDAEYVRRAYLDTIGVLPTAEEVVAFTADPAEGKRVALVDHLLARPEWFDYWTLQLCDVLQNRRERDHDVRGVKGVRAFHAWVRKRLAEGSGWDKITRDVLTASGDVREHPEIGYFITLMGEQREVEKSEIPDGVAQSFLGTRIGCARCHNHPLERFTQDDFYHFAAFFARTGLDRQNPQAGGTRLLVESREETEQKKRLAEIEKRLHEAEAARKPTDEIGRLEIEIAEHQKRLVELRAMPPQVNQPRTGRAVVARTLDGKAIDFSDVADPRETLAGWIIASPEFSGAMVNRLWRHFFAVGLVEPVDDLRASNPPSNPELWELLMAEFRDSGFDLRHVMRLLLTSRAYQLSSTTRPENETDRRFFSHYYARRLPAEVLLDAIASATGVPDEFDGYPVGLRAVQLPEPGVSSYFLTLFGRSDRVTACACERSGEVTLPQLLNLRNGGELERQLGAADGHLSTFLKNSDDNVVTDTLYLNSIARLPTDDERALVNTALANDGRELVYRDLFWALLNSKEFTFNH